ncbi:hypothetical protein ES708_07882 [subsurface metagenome]
MPKGNEVCVVGIDAEGKCIRPVCDGGFLKQYLYDSQRRVIIRHGAKVEFDLHPVDILPPHIEDLMFDPSSITGRGKCSASEWENTLRRSSFETVSEIYDGLIQDNAWVMPGAETKSIGTLAKASIIDVYLTPGNVKPRITFADNSGCEFERPASDLTMWDRCHYLVKDQGNDILSVQKELLSSLQRADRLYLRLGLARPWGQDGKCWLQVTGVYTFPDYLDGKCFDDF